MYIVLFKQFILLSYVESMCVKYTVILEAYIMDNIKQNLFFLVHLQKHVIQYYVTKVCNTSPRDGWWRSGVQHILWANDVWKVFMYFTNIFSWLNKKESDYCVYKCMHIRQPIIIPFWYPTLSHNCPCDIWIRFSFSLSFEWFSECL